MAVRLGKDAELVRNTGTTAAPVWDAVGNITDLTLNTSKEEDDVSVRAGGGWKQRLYTIKDGTVTFTMLNDDADPDVAAFSTAYHTDALVDCWILDGPVIATGSQGLRASFGVGDFTRTEPVKQAQRINVTIAPGIDVTNQPRWEAVP